MESTATEATLEEAKKVTDKLLDLAGIKSFDSGCMSSSEIKEVSNAMKIKEMLEGAPGTLVGAADACSTLASSLTSFENWVQNDLSPDFMEEQKMIFRWLEKKSEDGGNMEAGLAATAALSLPEPGLPEELGSRFFDRCCSATKGGSRGGCGSFQ